MAASPQIARVPVEVYLRSSYEPDAEYVDGVIEERPLGQDDHSAWQHAIQLWFAQRAKEWNALSCASRFRPGTIASPMSPFSIEVLLQSQSSRIHPSPFSRFCLLRTP